MKLFLKIVCLSIMISPAVYGQKDSIFATVSGDSVTIWDMHLLENCASRYIFSLLMPEQTKIVLHEIDTAEGVANCLCRYDLSVTLHGLEQGHYQVTVYRDYSAKKSGFPRDTSLYIGALEFDIEQMFPAGFAQNSVQSPCGGFSGVTRGGELPHHYSLGMNYPNPFNPSTIIRFAIPRETHVILKIYNLLGREVETLLNEKRTAGVYDVNVDGSKLTSGVYFYRLVAGNFVQTKKMVIVR